MSSDSSCAPGSPLLKTEPIAGAEPLSRPPSLRERVGRHALLAGAFCALAGAVEGAVIGSMLTPHNEGGSLILALAIDRGLLLGLGGAACGALTGLLDWYVKSRQARRAASGSRPSP
jgi:hypothetical protein